MHLQEGDSHPLTWPRHARFGVISLPDGPHRPLLALPAVPALPAVQGGVRPAEPRLHRPLHRAAAGGQEGAAGSVSARVVGCRDSWAGHLYLPAILLATGQACTDACVPCGSAAILFTLSSCLYPAFAAFSGLPPSAPRCPRAAATRAPSSPATLLSWRCHLAAPPWQEQRRAQEQEQRRWTCTLSSCEPT